MGKVILFIVLALVAYLVIKGVGRSRRPPPQEKIPERMVSCAHCGVNLPESESLERDGALFCCDDHRRLGAR